jgi:hypothetical protein
LRRQNERSFPCNENCAGETEDRHETKIALFMAKLANCKWPTRHFAA